MYIKKFEADSLDEALQNIKKDLGPEAIILKTITNKGLKGAFKKKKIEITAAISERSYVDKAKVDRVLSDDQKNQFYKSPADKVSQEINRYSSNYSHMGLNKSVRKPGQENNADLESFLQVEEEVSPIENEQLEEFFSEPEEIQGPIRVQSMQAAPNTELLSRLSELENRLFDLNKKLNLIEEDEPDTLYELKTVLKGLGLSEKICQEVLRNVLFEMTEEEREEEDQLYDFAIQKVKEKIQTDFPLFSRTEDKPCITLFLGGSSVGQTSMLMKIASMKEDCDIVQFETEEKKHSLAEKLFGLNIKRARKISELASHCKNSLEKGRHVFIDFNFNNGNEEENFKVIAGIKRAFDKVEVLLCLSAIQSEVYNNRMTNKFKKMANGLVVSHLDLCVDMGSLINISHKNQNLPFIFFGTGECIPEDIKAASADYMIQSLLS